MRVGFESESRGGGPHRNGNSLSFGNFVIGESLDKNKFLPLHCFYCNESLLSKSNNLVICNQCLMTLKDKCLTLGIWGEIEKLLNRKKLDTFLKSPVFIGQYVAESFNLFLFYSFSVLIVLKQDIMAQPIVKNKHFLIENDGIVATMSKGGTKVKILTIAQ